MRLFIAIDIPPEIKDRIESDFSNTRDSLWFAQFKQKDNLHITLSFLGEQNESNLEKIKNIIQKISLQNKCGEIKINSAVIGPSSYNPMMIWLRLNKFSESYLNNIFIDMKKSLLEENIPFDSTYKNFTGHLTLAKFSPDWNSGFNAGNQDQKTKNIGKIEKALPEKIDYSFQVTKITLLSSEKINEKRKFVPIFESSLKEC